MIPRDVSYAVVETNGSLSAALRPEKETATLADLQLKVEHSHATIPFVLDGQVLEENLHWCGKDQDWLERTAQANTLLPEEILLLVGNETEGLFSAEKREPPQGQLPGERCGMKRILCVSVHRGSAAGVWPFYSSWRGAEVLQRIFSDDIDDAMEAIRG